MGIARIQSAKPGRQAEACRRRSQERAQHTLLGRVRPEIRAANHRPRTHSILVEACCRRRLASRRSVTSSRIVEPSGFQRNDGTSYSGSPSIAFVSIAR